MSYIQIFKKRVIERDKGVPYLMRWNLLGLGKDSSLFSIKVHKIIRSDDECLHDHPWAFVSIILKGGYEEFRFIDQDENISKLSNAKWEPKMMRWVTGKIYKPGQILYRKAEYAHRLVVLPDTPCWTLVFTFKKFRNWGFFTNKGWKWYRHYNKHTDC